MSRFESVFSKITAIDSRLLVAGERLARYRDKGGTPDSITVQRGVCDRLLDERLLLMAERDRGLGT